MDLAALADVMDVLAGPRPRQGGVRSWIDLHDRLTKGLPKEMYHHVFQLLATQAFPKDVVRRLERFVVAPATLKRRKERLSPEESERLARVARLLAMTTRVFDDPQDTARFLTRPHPLFGRKSPIDLVQSDLGLRQVEEVLAKILYGLPV
jgi:putative toxin-antitoxin system antitoxin component (TIGR02293 family)